MLDVEIPLFCFIYEINDAMVYSKVYILNQKIKHWFDFAFVSQECYLENDQTSLYHTAKGLMTLQALYGTIPQIYGKGDCARVSVLLTSKSGG